MPTSRLIRPGGFAVLCADPNVQALVEMAGIVHERDYVVIDGADQLTTVIKSMRPCCVVIDREHIDADTALRQLAKVPGLLTILVVRDTGEDVPTGAQIVVFESSLPSALELAARVVGTEDHRETRLEHLVTVSVLTGPLEAALEMAAHHIAFAFAVPTCVISIRGDAGGSWAISSHAVSATQAMVRMTGTQRNPELCAWSDALLEQLVVLSGGRNANVDHVACEALGADACRFRVRWDAAQ